MDNRTIRLISQLEDTRLLLEALSFKPEQNLTYTLRSDINSHADNIKESYTEIRKFANGKNSAAIPFGLLGLSFTAISVIMILQDINWINALTLICGILHIFLSLHSFKTRISEESIQRIDDSVTYLVQDLHTYGSLRSISEQQANETIAEIDTLINNVKKTFG